MLQEVVAVVIAVNNSTWDVINNKHDQVLYIG